MNVFYKRVLSILLSMCLLFPLVTETVGLDAAEISDTSTIREVQKDAMVEMVEPKQQQQLELDTVPEVIGAQLATERNHLERRYDKEAESLNEVIFRNADGTETLYMFDYPVKYVSDTGEIKDIKLDIEKDNARKGAFVSAEHSIKTTFSEKISEGIHLQDDDVSITLQLAKPELYGVENADAVATLVDDKTVEYQLDDKTSLEYSLTYTGFKEDIVVSEYTGQTEYEFTLLTEGLTLEQIDGSYYLTDGNGNIEATIGDIIIFTADERNNALGSMTHETIRENEEYQLTIHVDADYLKDEATVYPIRIDPTIEINYDQDGEGAIQDVTINSETGSSGSSGSLFVGTSESRGISRVLMKFPNLDLDDVKFAEYITNATLELRDLLCEEEQLTLYCHIFTGNTWSESTANWSNVNPTSYVPGYMSYTTVRYSYGVTKTVKHRYGLNITDAVKGWKSGDYSQDKGIIIKSATAAVEQSGEYYLKTFASYNRASYKPSLTVTYKVPQYTISYLVDQGYAVRFGGTSNIYTFHNVIAGKYYRLFGVEINSSVTSFTSSADSCKISQFGAVTMSNLTASCTHSTTHLTTTALRSSMGAGSCTASKVLWTGHILNGNPSSNSNSTSYTVVITPRFTTDSDNGYANLASTEVRKESLYTLMHELAHQLGAPDHYCRNKDKNSTEKCSNEYCDRCVYGMSKERSCLMSYRYEKIETMDEASLFCTSCQETIRRHLGLYH